MASLFKTENRKKKILDLYDQKLLSLTSEYEYTKVNSSFRETNIIVTGAAVNPPTSAKGFSIY